LPFGKGIKSKQNKILELLAISHEGRPRRLERLLVNLIEEILDG